MLKSMTGYANVQAQLASGEVDIAVRSVNGRFFEVRFHLPKEAMALEKDFKRELLKIFHRGNFDVYMAFRNRKLSAQSVTYNEELALVYSRHIEALAKKLNTPVQLHPEALIRMPEVLSASVEMTLSDSEKAGVLAAFTAAAELCNVERVREGKALQEDLIGMIAQLEKIITSIQSQEDTFRDDLQAKIDSRLKSRMQNIELDPARLSQEIVYVLDKSDIHEELVRLQEHLKHFHTLLSGSEQTGSGKKLDFYVQELLREINTIGSKSQNAVLTGMVVEAKSLIERLREQVQNIE